MKLFYSLLFVFPDYTFSPVGTLCLSLRRAKQRSNLLFSFIYCPFLVPMLPRGNQLQQFAFTVLFFCLSKRKERKEKDTRQLGLQLPSQNCGPGVFVYVKDIGNTKFTDMGYNFPVSFVIMKSLFLSSFIQPKRTGPK